MPDYKAEYDALAARQEELLRKEKSAEGLTAEERQELRATIAKKSALQEHVSYPH